MSLLDDVSVVVTPNGYKAGTLYGVLPTATLGSEQVTNGDFATDSDWTKGTGWTISGGVATSDGTATNLTQGISIAASNTYEVTFTISSYTSGAVRITLNNSGDSQSNTSDISSAGTHTAYLTVGTLTSGNIIIDPRSNFVGSIDNVSVKEWTASDMDVTRATAATRVDENGLVNYAQVLGSEEVTNGDFATDSDWTKGTNTTIEDGKAILPITSGGMQFISSNTANLISGNTYKITLTTERTSGTGRLAFTDSSANNISGTPLIDSDGDLIYYFIPTSNINGFGFKRHDVSGNYTWEIDNISVKEVTRDNVPRIDYTGGGCPHILAEPQRTNEETKSNEFSAWTSSSGATATANYIVSPDGTQNAARIQFTSNGFLYNTAQGNSSTLFTISCYAKRNDSGTQGVGFFVNGSGAVDSAWSLTSDWKRFTYTYTSTNTSMIGIAGLGGADISVFGFQIEKTHSYATSYIPTSGSSVTRNQDLFTRDGINSLINSTEGVLFVEMAMLSDDLTNRFISINNGSKTERVLIGYSNASNKIFASSYVGNVLQCNIFFILPDMLDYNKVALKYKENDFALWVNGVEVGTDLVGSVSTSNTFNKLALDEGDGTDIMFAKVKQLQVYKTALTDNQLIQLTGEAGTHFFESYSEMAETLTYTIQ